jgi:16S rRNA (cytosine967-C5)-methyltransferase
MQTARDIVFNLLRNWTTISDPPFLPERSDDHFAQLTPRDRPFAFDLITGIIRWRKTLDAVIASRLKQPLETVDHAVVAVLWLGTYQLLFQSGTTDYAAVDTTVDLAKKYRETSRAAGLVNAVLRNITRLNPTIEPRTPNAGGGLARNTIALDFDRQLKFNEDIFLRPEANPIGHLAQVRSHPTQFVEHLRTIFGDKLAAELLLRNNLRPIITLRTEETTLEVPAIAGLVAHSAAPKFLVATAGWNQIIETLVNKGTLSPQDPTAAKPVRHLEQLVQQNELRAPQKILDLCAGLGTKTLQLARAFPNANITAADIDSVKLARLQNRMTQVGQKNVTTIDAKKLDSTERFDLILVDAPCSNTAVFSKRVQSRWRWPTLDHAALHKLQLQLLTQAASLLAPKGTLLYSTCSIDPNENTNLIQKFLTQNPTLKLQHEQPTLPSLTTAPNETQDGGYFALLSQSVSV